MTVVETELICLAIMLVWVEIGWEREWVLRLKKSAGGRSFRKGFVYLSRVMSHWELLKGFKQRTDRSSVVF